MPPHSSVLSSWSPDTRQSGVAGADSRRTPRHVRPGRWAISHLAREASLAGKIGGVRGAKGGVVALTRISTGQQISVVAGILTLDQRVFLCMPPPCLGPAEFDRWRKPEVLVAGSPEEGSGNHLTRRLRPDVAADGSRRTLFLSKMVPTAGRVAQVVQACKGRARSPQRRPRGCHPQRGPKRQRAGALQDASRFLAHGNAR